jgi:hypothetical protein
MHASREMTRVRRNGYRWMCCKAIGHPESCLPVLLNGRLGALRQIERGFDYLKTCPVPVAPIWDYTIRA